MTAQKFLEYLENGPFAWPGGYPLFFQCADSGILSFEAAEEQKAQILDAIAKPDTNSQWEVVAIYVNWEDSELYCSHTNKRIPSAYAD